MRQIGQQVALLVVAGLAVFILWPQRQALLDSLRTLREASVGYIVLALVTTGLTYALATVMYHYLLKSPVRWRELWLVQVATALTSRLAPIGVGTMGLTAWFLHRRGHSVSQALAVVGANNVVGFVGHMLLLCVLVAGGMASRPEHLQWHVDPHVVILAGAGILVLVGVALVFGNVRHRAEHALGSIWHALASYRQSPGALGLALATSLLLSLVYILTLSLTCAALDMEVPFATVFLVYTFSLFTGILTPTPGGLVGVEAGLVGGFVAYGYDAGLALSIALLYRLVTYWLPLVPGFFALRAVQHFKQP